jgi:hypothetical protein
MKILPSRTSHHFYQCILKKEESVIRNPGCKTGNLLGHKLLFLRNAMNLIAVLELNK